MLCRRILKRLISRNMQFPNNRKGFTLIELLVVISIIGLLSSVVLTSVNSARAKARDARRIADFKNVSLAMEFYYDKYGRYPPSPNGCCSGVPGGTHNQSFEAVASALVTEGFSSVVPKDPLASNAYMLYDYGGSIGQITVTALESISSVTVGPFSSCRPFDQNWCSYTIPSTSYCVCHPY